MNPNNFGRLIAYLTLVYKIADSYEEEIVREAVQRTVENLKHIDLEKYKVGRFISFKALLGQYLTRILFSVYNKPLLKKHYEQGFRRTLNFFKMYLIYRNINRNA